MTQTNGEESRRYRTIWPENAAADKGVERTGGATRGWPKVSLRLEGGRGIPRAVPVSFGEVLRVLPATGLEERQGTYSLLSVRYAVDRSRYLVYLLSCRCVGYGFRDL